MPEEANSTVRAKNPVQSMPTSSGPRSASGAIGKPIIAIAALAVLAVVVLGALYLSSGKGASYSRVYGLLSSGKPFTMYQLMKAANISLTSQATSSSAGNASETITGSASVEYSGVHISLPFSINGTALYYNGYSASRDRIRLFNQNLKFAAIGTPTASYECYDLNMPSELLSAILSSTYGGSTTQSQPTNYKCVRQQGSNTTVLKNLLSNSTFMFLYGSALNSTELNASTVKQTSFGGNSCVYISGTVTFNGTRLVHALESLKQAQANSSISNQSISITGGGPYSLCYSISKNTALNFSVSMNFTVNYSAPQSLYSPASSSEFGIGFSMSGVSIPGTPPSSSSFAALPYPTVNGTCPSGLILYSTSMVPLQYSCQDVSMNSTGGTRFLLSPSANSSIYQYPYLPGSSGSGTATLLGLACINQADVIGGNLYNAYDGNYNASYFVPVNMTLGSNSSVTLVAHCNGRSAITPQYTGYLYGVFKTDYTGTPTNTVEVIGSFSVLPTIAHSVGSNKNTGPVSQTVSISNTTALYPTVSSVSSSGSTYGFNGTASSSGSLFNTGSLCIAGPGYYCTTPLYNTNETIALQFGQSSGSQWNNTYLLFVNSSEDNAVAYGFTPGVGIGSGAVYLGSLYSGEAVNVSLPTGTSIAPGSTMYGYLWASYETPGQTSPNLVEAGTLEVQS